MVIDYIDPENRRIYLHSDTVGQDVHPIDIYKEMRTLRRTDESLRPYDVFLTAYGNIPKGAGKYTERYVQCMNGTRIVPYNTTHVLTIIGTIITDEGTAGTYCFDRSPLAISSQVDIDYQPPQVEVITITTDGGTGAGAQEIWEYANRELTNNDTNLVSVNDIVVVSPDDLKADVSDLSADVNVVEVNGVAVTSVDDFKADVSNLDVDLSTIPQSVWEYVGRELSADASLTTAQLAKMNEILTAIGNIESTGGGNEWTVTI